MFACTCCRGSDNHDRSKGDKIQGTENRGGSALLTLEHVWHGEIVPWFPFLTAASDPAAAAEMLQEMAAVGTGMTVAVTAVWLGMLAVSRVMEKRVQTERENA